MSNKQIDLSSKTFLSKENVYIDAVCGAGKTEIVFKSIEDSLLRGERVGFAIPRREVVLEIYNRLKEVFPSLNIALVYGGHTEYLDGDIICLTCHQCYRYKNKFGLLIVDEYDAFPLKGDKTLNNIVKNSCYRKTIFMSATFSKEFLKDKTYFSMNRRYHGYDIPVPKIIRTNRALQILKSIKYCKRSTSPIFIFLPTIKLVNFISFVFKIFGIDNVAFTSKTQNKESLFKSIKSGEIKTVICSTILERGITVKNLNVLILFTESKIFSSSTLIQILGRVGRKMDQPFGEIIYYCKKESDAMKESIEMITLKNNGYEK